MSIARFVKWIGVAALITGVIGFLVPGQFIFFPLMEELLTKYGNALMPGLSLNPMVKTLMTKAPVIILAVIGVVMTFWGMMKELLETSKTIGTKPEDKTKTIKKLIESQKQSGEMDLYYKKSIKERVDRKKL